MTAKMEEWIVAFVFAELLALALIIVVSCWCCRRSTRRAREEEAHTLPMTQVTRPQATAFRDQAGAPAATVTGSTTTAGLDSHSGSDANSDDDRESHEDDGASLVSGGLWSFVAGGATLNKPRRNSKKNKRGSGSGDVEVVNISVNAAEDEEKENDEDKMEPGAAALDKRGSAA